MAIGFFNQDSQPAKMGISLRQLGCAANRRYATFGNRRT